MSGRLLVAALVAAVLSQAPEPSLADWEWLDRYRLVALDRLMPVDVKPTLAVAYRSYRDLYYVVPERYFRIETPEGAHGRLIATVVIPDGGSIQQQLLNLHMRAPDASFESLVPRIAARRFELREETCSALKARRRAVITVPIRLRPYDRIVLHPFVHRIVIAGLGADVDATIDDDDNPLVRWAKQTADALAACGGRAEHGE